MSNSRCCLGWSLSIGCHIGRCTQIYIHELGKVPNSMFTTWSMHCKLLFIFKVLPPSSIWVLWLKTIPSRLTMAPLRQGSTHGNEGSQIPDALGILASESPNSKVSVRMFNAPGLHFMPLTYSICCVFTFYRCEYVFKYAATESPNLEVFALMLCSKPLTYALCP